jgi:hypothetical protein
MPIDGSDDDGPRHRNPFAERAAKTANLSNSHRRSRKQESSLAKSLGGRVTAGSGNKDVKGDVRVKGVARIEAKTTKNASFSVTREMINKIETAAANSGEVPALVVEFHDGFQKSLQSVAIVPMWALESLIANQKE